MHIAVVSVVTSFLSLLCLKPATQGWPTGGPCTACGDAFVVSLFTTLSRVAFIGCVVKLAIPGDLQHNVQWCGATQSAYSSGTGQAQ